MLLRQVKLVPLKKGIMKVRASGGGSSYESDLQLYSTEKTPRYKHYDVRYFNCNFEMYDDFIFAI